MSLTIYRRHADDCKVHKIKKLSAKAKNSTPIAIVGFG